MADSFPDRAGRVSRPPIAAVICSRNRTLMADRAFASPNYSDLWLRREPNLWFADLYGAFPVK